MAEALKDSFELFVDSFANKTRDLKALLLLRTAMNGQFGQFFVALRACQSFAVDPSSEWSEALVDLQQRVSTLERCVASFREQIQVEKRFIQQAAVRVTALSFAVVRDTRAYPVANASQKWSCRRGREFPLRAVLLRAFWARPRAFIVCKTCSSVGIVCLLLSNVHTQRLSDYQLLTRIPRKVFMSFVSGFAPSHGLQSFQDRGYVVLLADAIPKPVLRNARLDGL